MAGSEEEVVIDLSKMKVPELRKELQLRNLKHTGNKQELIDRLQAYLEEHEGAEVADDEFLKDDEGYSILNEDKNNLEPEAPEPVPEDKIREKENVEAKESKDQETEKTKIVPLKTSAIADVDKKAERAKKFGISVKDMGMDDRKKARQQRFGLGGGQVSSDPDKLKKRAERFGMSAADTTSDVEKKKLRLEKFGTANASPMDEKKKKRAERFGVQVA